MNLKPRSCKIPKLRKTDGVLGQLLLKWAVSGVTRVSLLILDDLLPQICSIERGSDKRGVDADSSSYSAILNTQREMHEVREKVFN